MSRASVWKSLAAAFFLVICALPASAGPPSAAAQLLPVPKSLEQGRVDRPLREKFKTEFASRDPQARGALGRKLREAADKETDPTARFVMLREARDLAVDAGDFSYAMAVIDDIAATFAIDAQEMKVSALSAGIDKSRLPPQDLARSYLRFSDESLAAWNTDLAIKAAYLATKLAGGDREILAEAKEREKIGRVRNRQLVAVIAANQKLLKNPDDPQSNLIVGCHVCFNTNRWELGLPYLAKSPPGLLKSLAERDLAGPKDPAEMAALADAWWDFSDTKANIPAGVSRRRAVFWYARALPGLSGEQKAQVEKRMGEVTDPGKP